MSDGEDGLTAQATGLSPALRAQVREMFECYDKLMWDGHYAGRDFTKVDEALATTDISSDIAILTGTIRFTSPLRNVLREWHPLRDRIKVELDRRGVDAERALRGLYELDEPRGLSAAEGPDRPEGVNPTPTSP